MSMPWSVEMYIFEEPLRAQQPEISARHQHRAWNDARSQARPVFVWRVAGATTTK